MEGPHFFWQDGALLIIIIKFQERLYRVAYENQIAQMESALSSAKSEMEVAKGKAQELESLVTKKDHVIAAQKVLHDKILVRRTY